MSPNSVPNPCPCTSGKTYNVCCGPLLNGSRIAATPTQLMRSRYSAFALGGHGGYLLKTWHPHSAAELNADALSEKNTNWQGLTVREFNQSGDRGSVDFSAEYRDAEGVIRHHCELSHFVRLEGKWFYVNGDIQTDE